MGVAEEEEKSSNSGIMGSGNITPRSELEINDEFEMYGDDGSFDCVNESAVCSNLNIIVVMDSPKSGTIRLIVCSPSTLMPVPYCACAFVVDPLTERINFPSTLVADAVPNDDPPVIGAEADQGKKTAGTPDADGSGDAPVSPIVSVCCTTSISIGTSSAL
jgi:hypothetical protein